MAASRCEWSLDYHLRSWFALLRMRSLVAERSSFCESQFYDCEISLRSSMPFYAHQWELIIGATRALPRFLIFFDFSRHDSAPEFSLDMQPKSSLPSSSSGVSDVIAEASEAILSADVLLLHLGAGMSADSNLAVFVDIANYPVYAEKGLSYIDLSTAKWLEGESAEPLVFYGFWGTSYNNYRNAEPHAGYQILKRFREESKLSFVLTSNIDSFVLRSGLADEESVYEYHGDLDTWQCSGPCNSKLWRIPPSYRFDVDKNSMHCIPKEDTYVPESFEHVASKLDPMCLETASHSIASFSGPLPTCPDCGVFARPSVLMFNSDDTKKWVRREKAEENRICFRDETMERFLRHSKGKLVIVEIGAGVNVPSMRFESERLLRHVMSNHRSCENPVLIRINPDYPNCESDSKLIPFVIPIPMRALAALEAIEQTMDDAKLECL